MLLYIAIAVIFIAIIILTVTSPKEEEPMPEPRVTYSAGFDYFTPDPGEWETCNCRACDELMEVERDKEGPTSFAEAMGRSRRKHDKFYCKNAGKDWHNQIIALEKEIGRTSSSKIAEILRQEINEIKTTHKATIPS